MDLRTARLVSTDVSLWANAAKFPFSSSPSKDSRASIME